MEKRPNILLLFTDQQRFDTIHALGNPIIRTPHLDRLCREGTAFTSAYSPSPVCVPARCSLHYGQYPMTTACYENGSAMPADGRPSFMDVLTRAGYRTHGIGKCHFTPDKTALRGFETRETQEECQARGGDDYMRFLDQNGFGDLPEPHGVRGEMYYIPQVSQLPQRLHPTQWIGDRSVAFVREQAGAQQPWLLFGSFIHPHPPFAPPSPWHKLYRAPLMPFPKHPQDAEALQTFINRFQNRYKYRDQGIDRNLLRNIVAHYYACISFIDYQVGRIMQALEEGGQLDQTLILFTSDHGELLGDYDCFGKRSMHDSAARIPMLARLPGRFDGGRICDRPASLVDIAPTVLTAAGCASSGMKLEGEDLHDLLTGASRREAVFSQYADGNEAIYTAVTDRWKYAYSAADNREFLFDRLTDGGETRNRARAPFCREALHAMREMTQAFLRNGGEKAALEEKGWRVYPPKTLSPDPDAHLLIQDPPDFKLDLPGYADR